MESRKKEWPDIAIGRGGGENGDKNKQALTV